MHYFEPEGFDEYYDLILQGGESKEIYIDPDCRNDINKTDYYNLLTDFLSKREKEFRKDISQYSFFPPKKAKSTTESDKKNDSIDDYKISAFENGECVFRITSDQFGFSAVESIYNKKMNYPLAKINLLSKRLPFDEKEKIRKIIIDYVKYSRTIGGAFVWPLPKDGRRICSYNLRRGNYFVKDRNPYQGYLEDRVDLTLLELKHALDGDYKNKKGNYKSDILYNEYTKKDGIMRKWLEHFHSFEEYVDYFMLECFIRDGMPIDIVSGEKIDENQIIQYKEEYKLEKSGHLQKLSLTELLAMIVRLETLILERTRRMEEYIK